MPTAPAAADLIPRVAGVLVDVGEPSGPGWNLLLVGMLGAVALLVSLATRRWLPVSEVVAFMAIGLALGPSAAGVISAETVHAAEPVTAVALGAMVFLVGHRLQLRTLRPIRATLLPMAVAGNLATFGVTFLVLSLTPLEPAVALLLAAMAPSTAPITVRALVSEKAAAGPFTEHLLAATAVNNLVSALLFGFSAPFVFATLGTGGFGSAVGSVLQIIGAAIGIGIGGGLAIRFVSRWTTTQGQRFLLVWVALVIIVGAVRTTGTSVVVTTLLTGATVANTSRNTDRLFDQVTVLEAPIFLVFFVVTGANVHINRFLALGGIGAAYIAARSVGRIGGAWLGMALTRSGRRLDWRWRTGTAQLPYAGMAVGLASFTVEKASESGIPDVGDSVAAIVLGAVFVFEIVTPQLLDRILVGVNEAGAEEELAEEPAPEPAPVRHVLVGVSDQAHVHALADAVFSLAVSGRTAITALAVDTEGRWEGRAGDQPALSMFADEAAEHGLPVNPVVRKSPSLEEAVVAESRRGYVDLVVINEPRDPGTVARINAALGDSAEVLVISRDGDAGAVPTTAP